MFNLTTKPLVNTGNYTASEAVKMLPEPMAQDSKDFYSHLFYNKAEINDEKLVDLIKRSYAAYLGDGAIKQVIDKYSEYFKDIKLSCDNEKALEYLEKRLNEISLASGEHWKAVLIRFVEECFRTGNPVLAKVRGPVTVPVKRVLYTNKAQPICNFVLLPITDLSFKIDDKGVRYWRTDNKKLRLSISNGGKTYSTKDAKVTLVRPVKEDGEIFYPGMDLIHLPYKKIPGTNYGVGITFGALNDFSLLRNIEQAIYVMIRKFSKPLYHHKITSLGGNVSLEREIQMVEKKYRLSAPDGLIVTGPTHDIKVHGSESHAIRAEPYLDYFFERGLISLGVSSAVLGIGNLSLGAAEASKEIMLHKVRAVKEEVSRFLEMYLLNELLFESGIYDPYEKSEHRVSLEFVRFDEDSLIKRRTAAADLFTKNYVDLEEARAMGEIFNPSNTNRFHAKLFPTKVETPATPGQKKSTAKTESMFEMLVPHDVSGVEKFLTQWEEFCNITLSEEIKRSVYELINLGDTNRLKDLLIYEC
jgi:hypothetical protein